MSTLWSIGLWRIATSVWRKPHPLDKRRIQEVYYHESNFAGTVRLVIELDVNYTGAPRSATITITSGGDKITVTVTQDGKTEDDEIPALFPMRYVRRIVERSSSEVITTKSEIFTAIVDGCCDLACLFSGRFDPVAEQWCSVCWTLDPACGSQEPASVLHPLLQRPFGSRFKFSDVKLLTSKILPGFINNP